MRCPRKSNNLIGWMSRRTFIQSWIAQYSCTLSDMKFKLATNGPTAQNTEFSHSIRIDSIPPITCLCGKWGAARRRFCLDSRQQQDRENSRLTFNGVAAVVGKNSRCFSISVQFRMRDNGYRVLTKAIYTEIDNIFGIPLKNIDHINWPDHSYWTVPLRRLNRSIG